MQYMSMFLPNLSTAIYDPRTDSLDSSVLPVG